MDRSIKPESRKSVLEVLREKKLAAVLATGVGIAALAGCAPSGEAKPSATQTQEAETPSTEVTPKPVKSETPSPTPTPEATPEYKISPETLSRLQGYERLDSDQFNSLPKPEQREFWQWKSADIKEFADEWYDFTKKPEDKYPAVISENNTPKEIATIQAYQLRYITALEPSERENALIAVLENGKSSRAFTYWVDVFAQFPVGTSNPKALAVNNYLPVDTTYSFATPPEPTSTGFSARVSSEFADLDSYFHLDKSTVNPTTGTVTPEWYRD